VLYLDFFIIESFFHVTHLHSRGRLVGDNPARTNHSGLRNRLKQPEVQDRENQAAAPDRIQMIQDLEEAQPRRSTTNTRSAQSRPGTQSMHQSHLHRQKPVLMNPCMARKDLRRHVIDRNTQDHQPAQCDRPGGGGWGGVAPRFFFFGWFLAGRGGGGFPPRGGGGGHQEDQSVSRRLTTRRPPIAGSVRLQLPITPRRSTGRATGPAQNAGEPNAVPAAPPPRLTAMASRCPSVSGREPAIPRCADFLPFRVTTANSQHIPG